jgi:hypothetical protein
MALGAFLTVRGLLRLPEKSRNAKTVFYASLGKTHRARASFPR